MYEQSSSYRQNRKLPAVLQHQVKGHIDAARDVATADTLARLRSRAGKSAHNQGLRMQTSE